MDNIVLVHSAQQFGNIQEIQALHHPGWQHSPEVPHHYKQLAASSSPPAPVQKPSVSTIAPAPAPSTPTTRLNAEASPCVWLPRPDRGGRHCGWEAEKGFALPPDTGTTCLQPWPSIQVLGSSKEQSFWAVEGTSYTNLVFLTFQQDYEKTKNLVQSKITQTPERGLTETEITNLPKNNSKKKS